MKANRKENHFKAITIEITLESIEEVKALYGRLNLTQIFINKQYTTGSCQPINPNYYLAEESTKLDAFEEILEEILDTEL